MDEPVATPEELRKWIFIGAAFGLPLFVLVAYLGDPGRGFAAGIAMYTSSSAANQLNDPSSGPVRR
jgi:hypothetical protein